MIALAPAPPAWAAGSSLSIHHGGAWHEWWRSDRPQERWAGPDPTVTRSLAWRRLADGVEWASVRLAGTPPAWRTELVVVRLDPSRVRLSLEMALSPDGRPAWTIDRAPEGALLAVNAGQFLMTMPWGWVVIDGRMRLGPGAGPLSTALAVDSSGALRWIAGDSLAAPPPRDVVTAFQSYPTLLADDGRVPMALRAADAGPPAGGPLVSRIDLAHRDARLAIGGTRDGRLLIVMTRFAALGRAAESVPIGPTTPEMAAIMGALGARDAVMLDGGISAQLLLRDPASGRRWRWRGWRKVPLALIARPRDP